MTTWLAVLAVMAAAPKAAPKEPLVDALDFDNGTVLIEDSGSFGTGVGSWSAWRLADGDPSVGWCSPNGTLTGTFVWQLDATWRLDTLVLSNESSEEESYPGVSAKGVELWLKPEGGAFTKVGTYTVPKGKKATFPLKGVLAKQVKLVVTGNWGHADYTELAEVDLLGARTTAVSNKRFAGLYDSSYGIMKLEQDGDGLYGCYGQRAYLFGTVSGPTARLTWLEEDEAGAVIREGAVTFAEKGDGKLWGIWFENGALAGVWEAEQGTTPADCTPRKTGRVGRSLKTSGRVVLYGIRFATNSDVPLPESTPTLEELAAALKASPSTKVLIEGHTDSTNTDAYNLELSERRAKAVVGWLTKQGVEASRLSSKGFGKAKPVAENATAQGRSLNRRVEVSVVK